MRSQDSEMQTAAISFAAKFGFLSKQIFFDEMCHRSKNRQYKNWNALVRNGLFHRSVREPDVLRLTKTGFYRAGPRAVKRRFHLYVYHDTLAARLLYAIKRIGVVASVWTEAELKEAPADALRLMGSRNIEKLPDLIIDLKSESRRIRIAVEVEASRKSKSRYDNIALSYARMPNIDLVICLCESEAIEGQFERAFSGKYFRDLGKIPATLLVNDFLKDALNADIRLAERTFRLEDFIRKALKMSE